MGRPTGLLLTRLGVTPASLPSVRHDLGERDARDRYLLSVDDLLADDDVEQDLLRDKHVVAERDALADAEHDVYAESDAIGDAHAEPDADAVAEPVADADREPHALGNADAQPHTISVADAEQDALADALAVPDDHADGILRLPEPHAVGKRDAVDVGDCLV